MICLEVGAAPRAALVESFYSQVTGDGHGYQPFGRQPFSLQPPESRCQHLVAELPAPELPLPVSVTRHLEICLLLLHLCTGRRPICTSALAF